MQPPTNVFICMFTGELIERLTRYGPKTYDEMKSFIGINLMLCITKKVSSKDYWCSKMDHSDLQCLGIVLYGF